MMKESLQENNDPVDVSIILPACNEEQAIGGTIREIKKLHPDFEVLVIDDGSSDSTATVAEDAGARVVHHPYNIGNGAAIKTGLRRARGKWIVMMDADGQHEPKDIARLLEHKDEFDMVVGARSKQSETSLHRDLANRFYNGFASYITRFKIKDLTSGFRLIKAKTVRPFIYLLPNTFSYPSTLTMAYLHDGRSVKYVPIQTRARIGKSKIRLLEDGARFFLIITRVATLFSPLRVFLPVSGALFLAASCYYLYTYITEGRFTNMPALLYTSSLTIFMVGLVAEQITQMRYDRVK